MRAAPPRPELDPRITLASLRQLAELHSQRSIGAVARRLGVSQPTVSANLTKLEAVLGVPLVARNTQGSTLTQEGMAVAVAAQAVVDATRDLAATVHHLPQLNTAQLNIAASLTTAEQLVPRWLADTRIAAGLPPGRAAISVCNSELVVARVNSGDSDIGFIEGNNVAEGLAHTALGRDELVVVGPAHP